MKKHETKAPVLDQEIDAANEQIQVANGGPTWLNDAPIFPDQGNGNQPGIIHAANDSRFVDANFSQPLTTYAIGWKDPNDIEATLEFAAPKVITSRRFEYMSFTNAEEFLSETDDLRSVGADFKRVEFKGTKVTAKTLNKGLTIRVDMDNVNDVPNWRELYTGRLLRRLWRNELRRAMTLLVANGANTGVTWDTTADKDPDQDVATRLIAFQDAAGLFPNRALYGVIAWNKRRIAHRAQLNAGGFASAAMTPKEAAQWFGLDDILVSRERYQDAPTTKAKVLGDYVIAYLAESGQSPEDPSNIKRFVSPTEGGTPIRVYEQQINAKLFDITVEHYSNVVITSTLGIQKLTVS